MTNNEPSEHLCDRHSEALHLAALTKSLDDGHVDMAAHWLELLVLSRTVNPSNQPEKSQTSSRHRRLKTLANVVAQMLDDCDKYKHDNQFVLTPGIADRTATTSFELSYAQLQMFALQQLQPSSTAYNVVRALYFPTTPFNKVILKSTINALVAKHEILRTCFAVNTDGQPRQFVHPLSHFQGPFKVFHIVPTNDLYPHVNTNDANLTALVAKVIDLPFNLAQEAPIRVYAFTAFTPSSTTPWILAVVLHHIATDAASSELLWEEFDTFYTHFQRQQDTSACIPSFLKQLETESSSLTHVTYRDFAVYERTRMRSGVAAPYLQYWTQHLTIPHVPPLLELPFDMPRVSKALNEFQLLGSTTPGDIVRFESSSKLQEAFTKFCHNHNASVFMGLLAVFYLLIERLSGQLDFVIGVPTSGRKDPMLQEVMGYFVNTLPLRLGRESIDCMDFQEFLTYVRTIVLAAYHHSEMPFYKVLEHLRASRDSERWQQPLYQVMFSWEQSWTQKSPQNSIELAIPSHSAKFDLMLSMRYRLVKEKSNERVFEGSFEYSTARFTRESVHRFVSYYLHLLEQVLDVPTASVRSPFISMLPRFEQHNLVMWGTPPTLSIHNNDSFLDECLYEQVEKTPENIALYVENTQWTYKDVWDASSRVRNALCRLNLESSPADLHIGLLLDRGVENVAAMIGSLRINAAFVPLDPGFPCERLRYMVQDSTLHVIITQRKFAELALNVSSSSMDHDKIQSPFVLYYEDLNLIPAMAPQTMKRLQRNSKSVTAYILYTSGSTGHPKGVMVSHAAILTTLWWTVRKYSVSPSDVFLQSTSATLDGSLSQLLTPLLVGGSVRITRQNGLHDLHYMQTTLLGVPSITWCVFVPSYFALLIDMLNDQGKSFPNSIKYVILAGEAFPMELARQFYLKHPSTTTCLVNEYGPTEASITSTAFLMPREFVTSKSTYFLETLNSVPIGKPIDHHPVLVLDSQRRLVPINVPGELYIGGLGIARGYWNRPELTRQSFILHDELTDGVNLVEYRGQRWYKTGDLVKWVPSGDLVFLGRTDAQVKHHGMRIELEEIRNVLLRHSNVKAAEVLSIPELGPALAAFVMPIHSIMQEESTMLDCSDNVLRKFLQTHLPIHMVPQYIHFVSKWPRTPNGKIDLRVLASMAISLKNETSKPKELQTNEPTITVQFAIDILRQVWVQALKLEPLHEDMVSNQFEANFMSKSFFELGGDSLAAIRAIALAQSRGVLLSLEQFFGTSSLIEMAQQAATAMVDLRNVTSQTLVPLNYETKATRVLFLFHDADGTVWKLYELARQLPFQVIGVQAAQLHVSSLEELAAIYWKEINAYQLEGPYALGGFSFGCRVAHEVARCIVRDGHQVLPLILLDGLPFEILDTTETEREMAQLQVEQYAREAFQDTLLQPLGENYRHFCAMEARYRPYKATEKLEGKGGSMLPLWLQGDLYMTQQWSAKLSPYEAVGIHITKIATFPDCSHLTMLRYPTVKLIAQAIRQRLSNCA
ncbi:hypothetical protein CCR75_003297 [Bremia lactucae]|uniref:Carrier domain-containing protein n=1 Tax=Bremia lactucae TaxID=4779 RepID=A0A976IL23_BRELC|nr:hypothetical protein CCR75_003297 [Bremia lactucae]